MKKWVRQRISNDRIEWVEHALQADGFQGVCQAELANLCPGWLGTSENWLENLLKTRANLDFKTAYHSRKGRPHRTTIAAFRRSEPVPVLQRMTPVRIAILLPWVAWDAERPTPPFLRPHRRWGKPPITCSRAPSRSPLMMSRLVSVQAGHKLQHVPPTHVRRPPGSLA
jgi:hypothetical protein